MASGRMLNDGEFGPPLGVRERPPRWGRRLGIVALGAALIALLGVGAVLAVIWHGARQVPRVDVPSLVTPGQAGQTVTDIEEITEVLNVLVVGSDSREGLTDEQLERLGTEREEGLRTDTIILVQLDPRREQVALLSFPRDLLVTRCDGSRGRINAAYGIGERTGVGGPNCLVDTVHDFSGIPVHHFVSVDFAGFIDVVDELGGVTLYLEAPLVDRPAGIDLAPGCVEMDGATALGFVRARHDGGDFGRIARQQRFIREVVAEAARVGTLVNLPRLHSLIEAGARAIETDHELSVGQMRRIAFALRTLEPDQIDTRTVPTVHRSVNGVAFEVAAEEEAERLFDAFRRATTAPEEVGVSEAAQIGVEDVPPLVVWNGTGIAGLAAETAEHLRERGFEVVEVGNAVTQLDRTEVAHPDGRLEEAELVAEALGGAELVLGGPSVDGDVAPADGEHLTVVLGHDLDLPADAPDDEARDTATVPAPTPQPTFIGATPSETRCR